MRQAKKIMGKFKMIFCVYIILQDACIRNVPNFTVLLKKGFSGLDKDTSDLLTWALDTQKFKICSRPKTKVCRSV